MKIQSNNAQRLDTLDYLRGLAAFSIMVYHYFSWITKNFDSSEFIGRLGIYGVSIFYILSGLTLFYVYYEKMAPSKTEIINFFKKRILRIFPLLWVATIATAIIFRQMDIELLLINLTGLFGFFSWDTYIAKGAWSIGNELVFYAFFPFFIILAKRSKYLFIILSLIITFLFIYFTFYKLNPDKSLAEQWSTYINPLNQIFFFLTGFLIGLSTTTLSIDNKTGIFLILIGFLIFILCPGSGDQINIVTGLNRLIFTFSCFLICLGAFKINANLPLFLGRPLRLLGEISYSIYLIHPVVYLVMLKIFIMYSNAKDNKLLMVLLSMGLTLIVSYFVSTYFERYFMKLVKNEPVNLLSCPKGHIDNKNMSDKLNLGQTQILLRPVTTRPGEVPDQVREASKSPN